MLYLGAKKAVLPAGKTLAQQIAAMFSQRQLGAWYDPSNYVTLFQDGAGVTPITAAGQPVGLMLDKRLGLVRGPELVSNPGPYTNTAGWADQQGNAPLSVSGGRLAATPNTTAASRTDILVSTTVGVWHTLTVDMAQFSGPGQTLAVLTSRNGALVPGTAVYAANGITAFKFQATTASVYLTFGSNVSVVGVPNILVSATIKAIPGNHLSQVTAASRPITLARVNLLASTEKPSAEPWTNSSVVTGAALNDGFCRISETPSYNIHFNYQVQFVTVGIVYTYTRKYKAGDRRFLRHSVVTGGSGSGFYLDFDLAGGVIVNAGALGGGTYVASTLSVNADGSFTLSVSGTVPGGTAYCVTTLRDASTNVMNEGGQQYLGDGVSGFFASAPQFEYGGVATRYQRVNSATDYDSVGFTPYLAFDGIDDSLATGAITLGADMDCFIAVRRNSASDSILAAMTGSNSTFIFCISGAADLVSGGAGTPTFAANGVDVPGGTLTTRAQLRTVIPQGQWVVVEARNANFSTWSSIGLSNYNSGFQLNGDIGGIILCPASDATARQKNRQYLGKKVGLVLP